MCIGFFGGSDGNSFLLTFTGFAGAGLELLELLDPDPAVRIANVGNWAAGLGAGDGAGAARRAGPGIVSSVEPTCHGPLDGAVDDLIFNTLEV